MSKENNSNVFRNILICVVILSIFYIYFLSWKVNKFNSVEISSKSNDFDEIYVPPVADEILELHRRLNLTQPGHLGKPVQLPDILPDDIRVAVNESYDEYKFNEFVSRLIPLYRELPDLRQGTCKNASYAENLPKVSIILAFYNEPFSMMMRTIYSILKNSPQELIEEILLVDDLSDKGNVGDCS